MAKEHRYRLTVEWTGNAGTGTSSYRAYERAHEIRAEGKQPSRARPTRRSAATRPYNPEDLLVASRRMLWY